jgi:hypothetical protein
MPSANVPINQESRINLEPFLDQGRVEMNPGSTIRIILTTYSIYNKEQKM